MLYFFNIIRSILSNENYFGEYREIIYQTIKPILLNKRIDFHIKLN